VGPSQSSCGRWLSKNLTGVSLPVNADIPADIQVHFVDEFDAHASPTGARGIGELGATGVAAAVANAVYEFTCSSHCRVILYSYPAEEIMLGGTDNEHTQYDHYRTHNYCGPQRHLFLFGQ
jgi:hypothetical protein